MFPTLKVREMIEKYLKRSVLKKSNKLFLRSEFSRSLVIKQKIGNKKSIVNLNGSLCECNVGLFLF